MRPPYGIQSIFPAPDDVHLAFQVIIDRVALAKQGNNALGSVRLSVRQRSHAGMSNNHHYQSKVIVCNQCAFADNHADAVDRLLIWFNKGPLGPPRA